MDEASGMQTGRPGPTWESARRLAPGRGGRRVLVLGCSPLPFENERMNYAPGGRTWQFARPLAERGHAVCVACQRIPGAYSEGAPEVVELHRDGVLAYTLTPELFDAPAVLQGLVEAFDPAVLVGASALPSRRAAELAGDRPLWVDLFGDPMAEAQAKSAVDGADDVTAYYSLMRALLERGDAFSAVSERQSYAVVGQLGIFGRLNRVTHGLELVHTVPCSPPPAAAVDSAADRPPTAGPDDLSPGDFVVLWSGGFNTWCDVDTLFRGLEQAMAQNPSLRFVSTGGKVKGHDEDTYGRFAALVEASEHRGRFLLKGRLPADEAALYLDRADLGVVTEKPIYERLLGSSARMVHWLGRGLPFVCARVSELSSTIEAHGLGLTYPPGDAAALARRILEAAAEPETARRRAERGRAFVGSNWTPERCAAPLCDWVDRAERLQDFRYPRMRSFAAVFEERIRDLEDRLERREADYQEVRGELGRIHHSKAWRWWMRYLAVRQALMKPFELFRKTS